MQFLMIAKDASDITNKIKIECPIHGIFMQLPTKHLVGDGCPECSGTRKKLQKNLLGKRYPN